MWGLRGTPGDACYDGKTSGVIEVKGYGNASVEFSGGDEVVAVVGADVVLGGVLDGHDGGWTVKGGQLSLVVHVVTRQRVPEELGEHHHGA